MRLEMIAYDHYVGTGDEGIGHLPWFAYASTDYQWQMGCLLHGTDN